MAHDGFSLDDKRVPVNENDIPDVIECWQKRFDKKFMESRERRIAALRKELAPLKDERLKLHEEINRLQFESVIAPSQPPPNTTTQTLNVNSKSTSSDLGEVSRSDGRGGTELAQAQAKLANLQSQISNPQSELDRLTR